MLEKPQVIELTEDNVRSFKGFDTNIYETLESGQAVTLLPPQPRLVHLSDLPDGTVIKLHPQGDSYYLKSKNLYAVKKATGSYREHYGHIDPMAGQSFVLSPGEFQVWQGGPCPWPEGVEVAVIMVMDDMSRERYTCEAIELDWRTTIGGQIIAHRCTGRLLQGAKLVS